MKNSEITVISSIKITNSESSGISSSDDSSENMANSYRSDFLAKQ